MRKLVYEIIIKYPNFSHVANEYLAIIKNGNLLLLVQSPVAPKKDTRKQKRYQLKYPFGSQHLSIQNSTNTTKTTTLGREEACEELMH